MCRRPEWAAAVIRVRPLGGTRSRLFPGALSGGAPPTSSARPQMLDRQAAEALFLQHLKWIERAAAIICAKHGLSEADTEDFTSWLKMRLIEDDYSVVRGFRGEANLKTYLSAVVSRQFVSDYRSKRGRWRPSAKAVLLGYIAVALETLVYRDHYTLPETGETLRTAGRTTLSDLELARLLDKLPRRGPLRPPEVSEPAKVLDAAPGTSRADKQLLKDEDEAQRTKLFKALRAGVEELPLEERLIVKMHHFDGKSIADVARSLGLEQKPLYRRLKHIHARLRELLEQAGFSADEVSDLFHFEEDAP